MNAATILYPVIALVFWTFAVLLLIPRARFHVLYRMHAFALSVLVLLALWIRIVVVM